MPWRKVVVNKTWRFFGINEKKRIIIDVKCGNCDHEFEQGEVAYSNKHHLRCPDCFGRMRR